MFSAREFMSSPSPSSLFSAYASLMASMMLARTILNDLIPRPIQAYLIALFRRFFKGKTSQLTLVIEENGGGLTWNEIFGAAELYLGTKIGPHTDRLKIDKCPGKKRISIRLDNNEKLTDSYDGIELKWKFVCVEQERGNNRDISRTGSEIRRFFELSFDKKHKEKILSSYVPYILERAKEIRKTDRVLKMFTLGKGRGSNWESINLEHPSTFETLAMEPEQKEALKEDLIRFLNRKEFYKRLTLSGLLNFIDGLWSSCGNERIIIFTTNHVDKLDPALLRPGRMDMHIQMSYCTFHGFMLLASNYLGISEANLHHRYCHVLEEIKGLIVRILFILKELHSLRGQIRFERD
ncbi:hypothetical protein CRG98_034397 [Punica granatum]|uniref:AAA-ATPase At5g17760-like n=1 Tax=Punica granatum TaxID=22663 RepID=A0A2I0IMH0_PUNGR|nr:hypothetical protein CRG98_034397 [Punica granatum]